MRRAGARSPPASGSDSAAAAAPAPAGRAADQSHDELNQRLDKVAHEDRDGERDEDALEVDQHEAAHGRAEQDGRAAQHDGHLRLLGLGRCALMRVVEGVARGWERRWLLRRLLLELQLRHANLRLRLLRGAHCGRRERRAHHG
eukprot:COSAG06_NODE_696_length_12998_cov_6.075045_10_plen_144_part_00